MRFKNVLVTGGTGYVGKHGTMIAGIRFGERRIFVGIGFPVEFAAVYDDAAKRTAVTADELCG